MILVMKTSSLGDIIHTLPALSDAVKFNPKLKFNWVVEEAFAEVPIWHKAVTKVIPVALRRWRHNPFMAIKSGEFKNFWQNLRVDKYDYIIDAQGLFIKSGLISLAAHGLRSGFNWQSAREPLASLCYQKKILIPKNQHAITRNRQLFAAVLGYSAPNDMPSYGINIANLNSQKEKTKKTLIFIHGSGRKEKCWPEDYWFELAKIAINSGFTIQLPWGNREEEERANRIRATDPEHIKILPKMSLTELANSLSRAQAAVAVDTGLGHLAAALDVPTVSLYGNTDPKLIGTSGKDQIHLTSFLNVKPATVWENVRLLL
jgi:heptosyltransferase I